MAGITWLTGGTDLDEPCEVHGSVHENYSTDKWTASVQLLCAWNQRYGLMNDILSNFLEWPYRPGSGMWAADGSIQPEEGKSASDGGAGLVYDLAKLTIDFERSGANVGTPGGGEVGPLALYTEEIEPSGEFITLDHRNFVWASTGFTLKEKEAPGRLQLSNCYTVKWTKLATIPVSVFQAVDHVNDDDVVSPSLGITFPTGTLLLAGTQISRTVTNIASDNLYDLSARFLFRSELDVDDTPVTWQQYWHVDDGGSGKWDRIRQEGGSDIDVFPSYDMTGFLP